MFDARTLKITAAVVALHAWLLYAVQSGLMRRAAETIMAQPLIVDLIAPETPKPPQPEPPRPKTQPQPPKQVQLTRPQPLPQQPAPQPLPLAAASSQPAPQAPVVPATPPAASAAEPRAPVASAPAAPRQVSIGEIQCSTPEPAYPSMSRRLGEQGTVRIRMIIGESGAIEQVDYASRSGFSRLDQAALDAARGSRCKPYQENGRPLRVTAVRPFVFNLE